MSIFRCILNYTITESPDRTWLTVNPLNGNLAELETDTIQVNFDASDLKPGNYFYTIEVSENYNNFSKTRIMQLR